jgi:hypothetical protein
MAVKEIRMARWFMITSTIASLLMISAGSYFTLWAPSIWYRAAGPLMVLFGLASFADAMLSRIVLDEEEIRLISLVRTRRYPRSDFESVRTDAGAVALKRKDGGWVVLPSTGHNALSVRNTVHAWVRRGGQGPA